VLHEDNVVLIMSPYVAKMVHAVSGGIVSHNNLPPRLAMDAVWNAMMDPLWPDDSWKMDTNFEGRLEVP